MLSKWAQIGVCESCGSKCKERTTSTRIAYYFYLSGEIDTCHNLHLYILTIVSSASIDVVSKRNQTNVVNVMRSIQTRKQSHLSFQCDTNDLIKTTTRHPNVQQWHKNNHYICSINIIIRDRLIPLHRCLPHISTLQNPFIYTIKSAIYWKWESWTYKCHDPEYKTKVRMHWSNRADAIIDFVVFHLNLSVG